MAECTITRLVEQDRRLGPGSPRLVGRTVVDARRVVVAVEHEPLVQEGVPCDRQLADQALPSCAAERVASRRIPTGSSARSGTYCQARRTSRRFVLRSGPPARRPGTNRSCDTDRCPTAARLGPAPSLGAARARRRCSRPTGAMLMNLPTTNRLHVPTKPERTTRHTRSRTCSH